MLRTIRRQPRKISARQTFNLYATTASGMENVLATEIHKAGGEDCAVQFRGVSFKGDIETVYRVNLWSRTAHRVLLELSVFPASNRDTLYEGARGIRWDEHISKHGTLAIDAVSSTSDLTHTRFVAQVIKDGIVDGFRERTGVRPSVDAKDPDLRLNARLRGNQCTLSIDTSGERLHRRGYRPTFGLVTPIKETLAAGILLKSGYHGETPLIDPLCGSGTFLVEGALIARNVAPGLLGRNFGFMNHPEFDRELWRRLLMEAKEAIWTEAEPVVIGSDISDEALRNARAAVQGAGVDDMVRLRRLAVADLAPHSEGMLVTNPPYGERLGEMEGLATLYTSLGDILKKNCRGMSAHILTGSKFLAGRIGLRPYRRDVIWNGPLECRLLHFKLY